MTCADKQDTALPTKKYVISKLIDFGAALPLVILYALGISGGVPHVWHEARHVVALDVAAVALLLSRGMAFVYMGLMIFFFATRRLPVNRARGWRPLLAAFVGSNMPLVFVALPHAHPGPEMTILSNILITLGLVGSIVVILFLGRSFGILAHARKTVLSGPYRFVRHPLYLMELVTILGIMWQFAQPWSALVAVACLLSQFPRMYFEEQVLAETDPAYAQYRERTARLVPGIY